MCHVGAHIFASVAYWTRSRQTRSLAGSGSAEGQSLTEPITRSFHKIVLVCAWLALSMPIAWSQTAPLSTSQNPGQTAPQANLPTTLNKYDGLLVRAIDFRGVEGTNTEMLRQLLVQKVGEPLDREKIRASLRTLYATGRFASLQVEAEANRNESVLGVRCQGELLQWRRQR